MNRKQIILLIAITFIFLFVTFVLYFSDIFFISNTRVQTSDVSYSQLQSDSGINTKIISSQLVGNDLIVEFYHNSDKLEPVAVIGNVDYELSKTIAKSGETVALIVRNWNNEYFELKVGSGSDVFVFGKKPGRLSKIDLNKIFPPSDKRGIKTAFVNDSFVVDNVEGSTVLFTPFAIWNGEKYSLKDLSPQIELSYSFKPISIFKVKWTYKISNIPPGLVSKLDYIGLDVEANALVEVGDKLVKIKSMEIDFSDIAQSYPVSINSSQILISGVKGKASLEFDPEITLDFVSPTDANDTYLLATSRNWTFVNASVTNTSEITGVSIEWDGVNVTLYNKSSLVGLWHLNNDTKDYSGWGNDGTINNDVNCSSNVGGKFRTACDFPGTDDRIEVSNTQSLNISGNQITLMAWVKPAVWTPNWQTVVNKRYGGDPWNNYILSFYASTLQPEFGISNCTSPGCQRLVDSPTAIPTNQWSHLAGVYNSSHIIIYVDAVEKNTLAVTGNIITSTELVRIGSAIDNDNEFNGIIDEVRIYNRSLSADEINRTYRAELGKYLNANVFQFNITDNTAGTYKYYVWANQTNETAKTENRYITFTSNPTVILKYVSPTDANATTITRNNTYVNVSVTNTTEIDAVQFEWNFSGKNTNVTVYDKSSLVGLWHLNNDALDYSGNGNDGTLQGNTNCNTTISGKFGTACYFDGSGDYIGIGSPASLNSITRAITVEAWVNADTYYDWSVIAGRLTSSGYSGWFIRRIGETTLEWIVANDTNRVTPSWIIVNLTGKWNHIAAWYNGTDAGLHVNGILVGSVAYSGGITYATNLDIGKFPDLGLQYWKGTIDEVRIYNRSLTADEINITYRSELGKYLNSNVFFQNFTDMADGTYNYKAYGNMTDGTGNSSEQRTLLVDTVQPYDLTSCQELNTANSQYQLTQNVSSDGTCFTITANNITLDGNGYVINHSTGATAGYGVLINGSGALQNIIVKNFLKIEQGSFSITNSAGISANRTQNITISNNSIYMRINGSTPANKGIVFSNTNNSIIEGNFINETRGVISQNINGIDFDGLSTNNTIRNNTIDPGISGNNAWSIYIGSDGAKSNNHTITNNTLYHDSAWGIQSAITVTGENNTISFNRITVRGSGRGIWLGGSNTGLSTRWNNITNNTILIITSGSGGNGAIGITFYRNSKNNTITNNTINVSNSQASAITFWLESGLGNEFQANNSIYNNIINISRSGTYINFTGTGGSTGGNNSWNTTLTSGVNIIGGNNIGGNYYGNSSLTGFSDTCADSDDNGICDSSLQHDENNTDYYPLASPPPYGLDACGTLDTADTIYTLGANVSSAGTCFTITANNVTLDGNGYAINYSTGTTAGYGVLVTSSGALNNITIRNFLNITLGNISQAMSFAVYMNNTINATVFNVSIYTNSSGNNNDGIMLANSTNTTIENSTIIVIAPTTVDGIDIDANSKFNTILNNTIRIAAVGGIANPIRGIRVLGDNTTIRLNTISDSENGNFFSILTAQGGDFTIIDSNKISSTGGGSPSIIVGSSDNIIIRNNVTDSNGEGINLGGSNVYTVARNNVSFNNITLLGSSAFSGININRNVQNNTISDNIIKTSTSASSHGITFLVDQIVNTIKNNTITRNNITVTSSSASAIRITNNIGYASNIVNNTIYNNIFNVSRPNTDLNTTVSFTGAYISNTTNNTWNTTLTSAVNIIGGNNIGGNYYGNSSLTGFSDTCADSDDNGICDSSLQHDENNTDYFPLASPPPYGLNACGTLDTADRYYKLTNNVSSDGTCFTITANNVTLDGNGYAINYSTGTTAGYGILVNGSSVITNATIKNFREIVNGNFSKSGSAGIFLNRITNSTIDNNTISIQGSGSMYNYGIRFTSVNSTNITGNFIDATRETRYITAVNLDSNSRLNLIRNNTADTGEGASLDVETIVVGGSNNTIENNTLYGNSGEAYEGVITISGTSTAGKNNIIIQNVIRARSSGVGIIIAIDSASFTLLYNNITNNTIYVVSGSGIATIRGMSNNTIERNLIYVSANGIGIHLDSSSGAPTNTTIVKNTINVSGTGGASIKLSASEGYFPENNTIYNNIINISRADTYVNFTGGSRNNTWNTTLTSAVNIIGGNNIGGNYYGNSSLTGFSDTCADADFNGICDSSLQHDQNNTDYFPLASPPPYGLDACGTLDTADMYYKLTNNVSSDGTCFTITANNVTLDGNGYSVVYASTSVGYGVRINGDAYDYFTIKNINITQNGTQSSAHAIYATNADFGNITNNTLMTKGVSASPIYIETTSTAHSIGDNNITTTNAGGRGIYFGGVTNSNITGNVINTTSTGTNAFGVQLVNSANGNNITNNTIITAGDGEGIVSVSSSNMNVSRNTIRTSGVSAFGIDIWANSDGWTVALNDISASGSSSHGIRLQNSSGSKPDNNNITTNNITVSGANAYGIYLSSDTDNTNITRNRVKSSNSIAIVLENLANTNTIYDNLFNGSSNWVSIAGSNNTWNTTLTSGVNIIGGNNIGGNYYGNSSLTGFSDTCADSDDNGICDSSLQHDENNTDYFPLASPPPYGLDACGTLDTADMYYKLTNNVSSDGTCFTITANNVTLDGNGYMINHSTGATARYGVLVNSSGTLSNTTIKNFLEISNGNSTALGSFGIYLNQSYNALIQNNTIKVRKGTTASTSNSYGIVLSTRTNYTTIEGNVINGTVVGSGNMRGVILVYVFIGGWPTNTGNARFNTIRNNTLDIGSNPTGLGSTLIDLFGTNNYQPSGNRVENNTLYTNEAYSVSSDGGIAINQHSNSTVVSNIITVRTTGIGISTGRSGGALSGHNISNNTIYVTGNGWGIYIARYVINSTIAGNIINVSYSRGAAIQLTQSSNNFPLNNTIYNNLINISRSGTYINITGPSRNNTFNTTLTSAVNIIGGNNIGGNYYGNSSLTGFSDTCADADFNGICDSSLQHDENNTDYLPLTNDRPPGWSNNQSSYPSQYSPSLSIFNITWQDSFQFKTSLIEINHTGTPTNYTMVNFGSNVYSYNVTLPVGTFYWKSYGNDSINNWNVTDAWYFTINQNSTNPVDIYLINGTGTYRNQNITIDYGEITTANATMVYSNAGTASLFEDGSSVSNPRTTTLSAGTHSYKGNTTGNANYSSNSTGATYYIIVNPATYTISIELNATNVRWNEGVNLSGYASKGTPFSGWIQVRQSSTLVCNITTTNGYYSCVFSSPSEVGNFTYTSYILNTNGDVLVQNSTVLTVAVSYGGVVEGKNVACYEEPRIIQNPDGSIKVATVRICAWK